MFGFSALPLLPWEWRDRLATSQAPPLLRPLGWLPWRRRIDCTSSPFPHNSGEYIGAGEMAPQAPQLTSWRASTGEGGLHQAPLPTLSMISLSTPCAASRSPKRLRQRSALTLLSVSKVANELVKGFAKIIDGSAQPDCSSFGVTRAPAGGSPGHAWLLDRLPGSPGSCFGSSRT